MCPHVQVGSRRPSKKKDKSKRKRKLPKGYNPELPNGGLPPIDPERWLPKWQRTETKRRKKTSAAREKGNVKGSQVSLVEGQLEQLWSVEGLGHHMGAEGSEGNVGHGECGGRLCAHCACHGNHPAPSAKSYATLCTLPSFCSGTSSANIIACDHCSLRRWHSTVCLHLLTPR